MSRGVSGSYSCSLFRMYRPQRSPGAQRAPGRFPSPGHSWGFPFTGSPQNRSPFTPGSAGEYVDGFGYRSMAFASPMQRGGNGFRRPRSFNPKASPNFQSRPSDVPVEKYFSPMMLEDPWEMLQPISAADAATAIRKITWPRPTSSSQ
uniref:M-phase specific PLK1 interacting protein n=1 Tax=Nothobranchius kuhntae TaxID=321403 RepID=A0A1A8K660_NOTKU